MTPSRRWLLVVAAALLPLAIADPAAAAPQVPAEPGSPLTPADIARLSADADKRSINFVPQEKLSMRKIREVLRLRFELGLPQDQIARSCSISQATVHRYLERAAATALSWPLPEDCDDRHLQQLLFPGQPGRPSQPVHAPLALAARRRQLQAHN